jgi:hypothetical protein
MIRQVPELSELSNMQYTRGQPYRAGGTIRHETLNPRGSGFKSLAAHPF